MMVLSLSVRVAANGFLLLVGWGIYQYNNEEYIIRRSQNFFLAKTSTWRDLDRFKVCSLLNNNQCLSITRECGVFIRPRLERHRRKLNSA
jgi:hypothetical protein